MHLAPPSSPPDAPAVPVAVAAGWRRFLTPDLAARAGIVGLAAFLRLFWLAQRPPHFDEGVNGWFTDQMQHTGFYKYDPSNYHGPLHFYVLFLFKCLLGRNLWALRLPVALVGIVTVDWIFRFRAFFGWRVCAWAALAMALSPGTTYFQRDAIHETWLVFFLVLAFWGICGLWQVGGKRHLWGLAMGVTGAILTKETYLVHFGCFLVAIPILWVLEDLWPSTGRPMLGPLPTPGPEEGDHTLWDADEPHPPYLQRFLARCAPQLYRPEDVLVVVAVGLALLVFFYSGNFYNWNGLKGLASTFTFWGKKATEGEGHIKAFIYWSRLVALNEPLAVLGVLACLRWVVPPLPTTRFRPVGVAVSALCLGFAAAWFWRGERMDAFRAHFDVWEVTGHGEAVYLLEWGLGVLTVVLLAGGVACLALPRPADWRLRLLAIYAPGTLLAYSLIPYKTPWCAISFLWPFFFAAGAILVELADRYARPAGRWVAWGLGGALAAVSASLMVSLNYLHPTDEHLDYVYVQTFNDMWRISEPMLALAEQDPREYHLMGIILCGSSYPLPWVLGDFTSIGYYSGNNSPPDYRADFLLVEDTAKRSRVTEVEGHLDADYFKQPLYLRPGEGPLYLYLRASLFGFYFPDRRPEFHPGAPGAAVPSGVLPPGETLQPHE